MAFIDDTKCEIYMKRHRGKKRGCFEMDWLFGLGNPQLPSRPLLQQRENVLPSVVVVIVLITNRIFSVLLHKLLVDELEAPRDEKAARLCRRLRCGETLRGDSRYSSAI
ncbi:hypothetical protein Q8A73_008323 [Channa argus]|nr:hypothetical protein Q8A73_008323 [Channa argus]